MEIKILDYKKINLNTTPRYLVDITFMRGDADGYEHATMEFIAQDENQMKNLKRLVFALECCNSTYPHGRGGYDEYYGLLEYDAFFNEEIEDDFEKVEDEDENPLIDNSDLKEYLAKIKELNPDGIFIYHPSDENGIQTSFRGYKVTYFDNQGNSFPTELSFNSEEKARFEECKKHFK